MFVCLQTRLLKKPAILEVDVPFQSLFHELYLYHLLMRWFFSLLDEYRLKKRGDGDCLPQYCHFTTQPPENVNMNENTLCLKLHPPIHLFTPPFLAINFPACASAKIFELETETDANEQKQAIIWRLCNNDFMVESQAEIVFQELSWGK